MSAIDGHNYPIVAIDDRDPVTTIIVVGAPPGALTQGHLHRVY
jgi:hypothetical protein